MKKFLVVYMADRAGFETMMRESTPEMQKAGMAAWMKWMTDHHDAVVEAEGRFGRRHASIITRVDARNELPASNRHDQRVFRRQVAPVTRSRFRQGAGTANC